MGGGMSQSESKSQRSFVLMFLVGVDGNVEVKVDVEAKE